jgi:hypothetical protein
MTDAVAEAQATANAAAETEPTEIVVDAAPVTNEPAKVIEGTPASESPSGTAVEQVGALIVEAGLSPQEVAKIVSENGGNLTPALFKSLVDKHGEATTNIIADNLKTFNADAESKGNAVDQAIYSQVKDAFKGVTEQDGEATWRELSTWAKDNIPSEQRAEINELLKAGGLSAEFAVNHLVQKFQSDPSYTQSASLEEADGVSDSYGTAMIDKATYDRELRRLQSEGHDYNTSPEIAKLQRQRSKAIRRGR